MDTGYKHDDDVDRSWKVCNACCVFLAFFLAFLASFHFVLFRFCIVFVSMQANELVVVLVVVIVIVILVEVSEAKAN